MYKVARYLIMPFEAILCLIFCAVFIDAYAQDNSYGCDAKEQAFGEKIQLIFKNKDFKGLHSLMGKELAASRPSEEQEFASVFQQQFIDEVVGGSACWERMGSFAVANGSVWFERSSGAQDFVITAINANFQKPAKKHQQKQKKQRNKAKSVNQWRVGDKILGAGCFTYEWISSDNYKAFFAAMNDQHIDSENFSKNPGLYITAQSNLLKPTTIDEGVVAWFAPDVNECTSKENVQKYQDHSFEIIGFLSTKMCQKLAPSFAAKCKQAKLVKVGDNTSGSMGRQYHYNIYGLFELKSGQKIIVPLKNFRNENAALKFINLP